MVKKRTMYEGVQKIDISLENGKWRVMIIMLSGEESGKKEERMITEEVVNQVVVNGCRVNFIGNKASIEAPEGNIRITIDHDITQNIKSVEIFQ